jgi:hypothetical protein
LFRATPGDRDVTVEWDNLPEILADAGIMPGAPYKFWGYRVYRLDQWRRDSLLPPSSRWQQIASFAVDTTFGSSPLVQAVNAAVDYDSIAYERKHYPVGRYRFVDTRVLDGWDYHYVVTAVAQRTIVVSNTPRTELIESPFRTLFSGIVRPRLEAGDQFHGGKVWVVPNPFRAHAPWEREPVPGDVFTRHVDFFGLPRAKAHIKIFTLAGDFVQAIDHDGTNGDGEAPWNLISRNGQDIESASTCSRSTRHAGTGRQVRHHPLITPRVHGEGADEGARGPEPGTAEELNASGSPLAGPSPHPRSLPLTLSFRWWSEPPLYCPLVQSGARSRLRLPSGATHGPEVSCAGSSGVASRIRRCRVRRWRGGSWSSLGVRRTRARSCTGRRCRRGRRATASCSRRWRLRSLRRSRRGALPSSIRTRCARSRRRGRGATRLS